MSTVKIEKIYREKCQQMESRLCRHSGNLNIYHFKLYVQEIHSIRTFYMLFLISKEMAATEIIQKLFLYLTLFLYNDK